MKIATWNVNSVKARLDHLLRWLSESGPDVALLQELKCTEDAFPLLEVRGAGYHAAVVGQKAYNGVAILSKTPIEVTATALPGDSDDEQARYVEGIVNGVRVASIYLPNGNPVGDQAKFAYKLGWLDRLRDHAARLLETEQAFVLGGDYNVIPGPDDVHDPAAFAADALFHPRSKAGLRALVNLGLTDAFKSLHPEAGRYTWWAYQAGAWSRDQGVRIDHLLLSPQAADRLTASAIERTPRGWEKPSDHTPVWCEIS